MRRSVLVLSVAACGALVTASAFAGENWVGTWKLNAAKSQLTSSGISARTLRFERTPEGIKLSAEGADAQGNPIKTGYTSKFDGADVPWPGNPVADTAAPKRIDDNTYENVWKKGGKATVKAVVTVSSDGKTMTITQDGTDPQGNKVHSVALYERQ